MFGSHCSGGENLLGWRLTWWWWSWWCSGIQHGVLRRESLWPFLTFDTTNTEFRDSEVMFSSAVSSDPNGLHGWNKNRSFEKHSNASVFRRSWRSSEGKGKWRNSEKRKKKTTSPADSWQHRGDLWEPEPARRDLVDPELDHRISPLLLVEPPACTGAVCSWSEVTTAVKSEFVLSGWLACPCPKHRNYGMAAGSHSFPSYRFCLSVQEKNTFFLFVCCFVRLGWKETHIRMFVCLCMKKAL